MSSFTGRKIAESCHWRAESRGIFKDPRGELETLSLHPHHDMMVVALYGAWRIFAPSDLSDLSDMSAQFLGLGDIGGSQRFSGSAVPHSANHRLSKSEMGKPSSKSMGCGFPKIRRLYGGSASEGACFLVVYPSGGGPSIAKIERWSKPHPGLLAAACEDFKARIGTYPGKAPTSSVNKDDIKS